MKPTTLLVLSKPNARHLEVLARLPDSTRIVVGENAAMFTEAAPEANALLNGMMPLPLFQEVFKMAPKLEWVHSLSAGLENSLFPEIVASPVPMSNSRGVFARSLAEFVICGLMHFEKLIPTMQRLKAQKQWQSLEVGELHGKTMGIIGYGKIGQLTAARAKAFGVKVIALRRRPELSQGDPNVDATYTPDRILELAAASDYVVCSAPITPDTKGLISRDVIAAMKPSALFVNVGRGQVVDEGALIEALSANRIRGAALDVFTTEPLPPDSPFWTLENVLVSPHSADHTATWLNDAMSFFADNFDRFANGQALENVVDKHAGY